jgi:serine/threonine-protein phosphatase 2A regulatory subunit B''
VISIYVSLAVYAALLLLLYLPFLFLPGILQMNYEDFCHIATVCTEQIGQKCKRFFSPSNFMKFEKDDSGRIAILPFYLYVMRTVSYFLQASFVPHASFCV